MTVDDKEDFRRLIQRDLTRKAAGMERYNIAVKENPFDGCPYADMVVSDDGAYMRYDDAKRALDAERADNAMAREAYWATIADLRSELATLQAQLRQVEGERAKWEDIAGLRFAGDHKFVKEMELLKVENSALQQRVAQLEGEKQEYMQAATNEPLNEPLTYGALKAARFVAKRAFQELVKARADHAALLGLVRALPRLEGKVETKESEIDFSPYWGLTDGTYFIPETPLFETKGEAEAYITLLAYRASLPAQPAQGGVKCVWVDDEGGIYQTGCKHAFMVDPDSDEPPIWIKFCCYCGSLVEFFVPDAEGETRA